MKRRLLEVSHEDITRGSSVIKDRRLEAKKPFHSIKKQLKNETVIDNY